MYLDNPKKLFEALYNIDTLYDIMTACREDCCSTDLDTLVSIVYDQMEKANAQYGLTWNPENYDRPKEIAQLVEDKKKLKKIYNKIRKEKQTNEYSKSNYKRHITL